MRKHLGDLSAARSSQLSMNSTRSRGLVLGGIIFTARNYITSMENPNLTFKIQPNVNYVIDVWQVIYNNQGAPTQAKLIQQQTVSSASCNITREI